MVSSLKSFFFLVLLLNLLLIAAGCKKKSDPAPVPVPTLKSIAPIPIGAAVNASLLQNNKDYLNEILTQYNSITVQKSLLFNLVEAQPDKFNFYPGDSLIGFATQNHKRMNAYALIWNQALPDWVLNFSGDSLAWENIFKTYIQTTVGHFKGQINSWDVVNEAIRDDDGSLRDTDVNPGDGSIWRRHLGPDYIERAFKYAHDADGLPYLFYNDYGQELNGKKLDAIIALVTRLKSKGVPIDGIGMEMHIAINTDNNGIIAALQKLAATGLRIHISALDISVNPNNDPNIVFTDTLQQIQAAKYQFVARAYLGIVPPAQQYGITTWGVSDSDSWIPKFFKRKDWPLLFDSNYKKMPAYYGLLKGFQ
jgi:endo-1,4-beta-xylanase